MAKSEVGRSLLPRRRREDQSFRNVIGTALGASALMLTVVAILINSQALFYMSTGIMVTIGACRLQSYLAVRGLRVEREAPETVTAGDLVTVHITVWSEHQLRRPLITLRDNLPRTMIVSDLTPSLPIAPAFDIPVQTQYQFRPMKRGKYQWKGVLVEGTDALGLTLNQRPYATENATMTVLPIPVPVQLDLPTAAGWGISEAVSGQSRGAGIEPRGIREYVSGDPLRNVHWVNSARTGKLVVKEFEAGSNAAAAFAIQDTIGTEVGVGFRTTLEAMCSHAAFLIDELVRQGARVELPMLEGAVRTQTPRERMAEVYDVLAGIRSNRQESLAEALLGVSDRLQGGSVLYALIAIADNGLIQVAGQLQSRGITLCPLIYDADRMAPAGRKLKFDSAALPSYVDALRQAGARPMIVPLEAYPS